ncbi:MAG: methylated-DNA--[protein]-cysteine S-methyltransferase [Planctomycetes bacterium]|nr:methylated-DNA--[protein]-cysteine S-methyltransferase [Planctomycetota bacterium]
MKHVTGTFSTPLGTLSASLDAQGRLWELRFVDARAGKLPPELARKRDDPLPELARVRDDLPPELARVRDELAAYFAGERESFDLELSPRGTPFQRAVWQALCAIPFGETRSYAELARRIGRPKAVRAVGAANGANPWAIVVPCHRVIGADGSLTGYAGGLERKRELLARERAARPASV